MLQRPGKIVCVGRNYREHAAELGNAVPTEPLLFLKPSTAIIANGDAIVTPSLSKKVEHEGEIGVVIGAPIRRATEAQALAAIRGIVALNDVTARDLQKSDPQWTRGKSFDTFCPIGTEWAGVPDFSQLVVVTRVNGVERQRGLGKDMVFSVPTLLAYISQVMTLEPGDIVATGTPSGVGPLVAGDTVEVEVIGYSTVSNPVVAES
jgi:2-keto-4-pentenoate hydratase/2-oxohepta-3-ene-1,7-dioic acid hydratase in catechol pathway